MTANTCPESQVLSVPSAILDLFTALRLVRPLRRFDDRDRARSPEIMPLAQHTLRIQLIVFGIELERYIALFLVGHHQIQVLAPRAAHERGLARIESQNVHTHPALWMRNRAA